MEKIEEIIEIEVSKSDYALFSMGARGMEDTVSGGVVRDVNGKDVRVRKDGKYAIISKGQKVIVELTRPIGKNRLIFVPLVNSKNVLK